MEREQSPEIDDELFNEVYGKAYSGPVAPSTNSATPKVDHEKRTPARDKSDEEDEPRDPNAVPTDFTSREARVWEAKAKATERNWKKRKEEEMICKICGESGHFTQGCPSTLGANRRNADFFERVPARDKQVRDLFTERTISLIEKDVGCKIRMDEKFLFVSGKDRLVLSKGVDAVHKIIQESKGKHSSSSPKRDRSRSPVRNSADFRPRHSVSQRSHSPRNASQSQSKGYYNERSLDGRLRDDMSKYSKGSPQAYAYYGAKGRPAHSKSPCRPSYLDDSVRPPGGNNQCAATHMLNNRSIERHGPDSRLDLKYDLPSYPQTLEELEIEFKKEAMELARARDQEEDEENYKHRESLREMRENHMKRVTATRSLQARKWDEFLEQSCKRQQQSQQTSYTQAGYPDLDERNAHFAATGPRPMIDSKNSYPYTTNNYSAPRTHAAYDEFQHERHDDFRRTYGRY